MNRVLVNLVILLSIPIFTWADEAGASRVIVGVTCDYPPYEYLDENKKPTGFDVDLFNAVTEVMGIQARIVAGPWSQVRNDLEQGRIHVSIGMFYSQERDRLVDFSEPFLIISHSIFVRKGSPIGKLSDVRDREVLVIQGEIMHDLVLSTHLTHRIATVDNPLNALKILGSGKCDCALLEKLQGLYLLRKHDIDNIVSVGEPIGSRKFCFAVREGDKDLLAKLNEGLRIVKASGKYTEIYDKWFGLIEEEQFAKRLLTYAAAIILPFTVFLAVILIWSWTLRRAVAVRTRELNLKVSECLLAEEELRGSRRRLADIIDFLPDATIVIDEDKRIIAWNRAMVEMTGVPEEDILGKDHLFGAVPFYGEPRPYLIDLIGKDDIEIASRYSYVHKKEDSYYAEAFAGALYQGKGAYIWAIASPLYDDSGKVTGAIESVRDITEKRMAQEALQDAHDRLEERVLERTSELREVNEELKRFAYFISHDLRAPLINLKGFTSELRSTLNEIRPFIDRCITGLDESKIGRIEAAFRDDIPEALGFIDTSVTRMDDLINAVLKLSRMGRQEIILEDIDTAALVRYVLKSMEHQIGNSRAGILVYELPHVVADRTAMEHVFGNLIDNAVKYLSPDRTGEIRIWGEQEDDSTTFHISDNGRGIAPEDAGRVFELFRRVGSQDTSGYGMGLNYVQTLVRRHGGRIWCESELGAGTTFSFTIANGLMNERGADND